MSSIQAGELPQRPSDGIPDPIWAFLETCWSRNSWDRPSTVQVYDTLSRFQPTPLPMEEPPHSDNNRTVPIPDVCSEGLISGVAQNCIDESAEVTQLVLFPPSSHRIPTFLGTRMCESEAGGERYRRACRCLSCAAGLQNNRHHPNSGSGGCPRPTPAIDSHCGLTRTR